MRKNRKSLILFAAILLTFSLALISDFAIVARWGISLKTLGVVAILCIAYCILHYCVPKNQGE